MPANETTPAADLRSRQEVAPTPLPVNRAHFVEPVLYPELPPFDGPRIHHPECGWGTVVLINDHEFRVRFGDVCFAWFKLDDPAVSQWPIEKAARFARWVRRAA